MSAVRVNRAGRVWVGVVGVVGLCVLGAVLLYRSYFGFGGPSWTAESLEETKAEMRHFRDETLAIIDETIPAYSVSRGLSEFEPELSSLCGSTSDHADVRLGFRVTFENESVDTDAIAQSIVEHWVVQGFRLLDRSPNLSELRRTMDVLKDDHYTLHTVSDEGQLDFGVGSGCRHSPGWKELR